MKNPTRSPAAAADIAELSATQALHYIRDGSLTAERYACVLLARCEAGRELNAVSWIDPAGVLESARSIDAARARGAKLGPLAGLPLLVKDNIDTVGFPTSAATPALRTNFPASNAPGVDALLAGGAYLLAKANMAELALSGTSSESIFGPVRNPYDGTRFAGGSSGGTAAGIAARMAPVGLGTDTAGSGRIPAAFCGVVGFRPSTPAASSDPNQGIVPLARTLDTVAPMARTVGDVALLHAVLCRQSAVEALPLRGVRFGIARRFLWDDLEPEVARVTQDALAKLTAAGAIFEEADLRDIPEAAWALQRNMMLAGMNKDLAEYLAEGRSGISAAQVIDGIQSAAIRELFKSLNGSSLSADALRQMEHQRPALSARFAATLAQRQLAAIVFPCEFLQAQIIKQPGDRSPWIVDGKAVGPEMVSRNTRLAAALGLPALTIPSGLTREGLPVALEFDAPAASDGALLGLGQSVQDALGLLAGPRLAG